MPASNLVVGLDGLDPQLFDEWADGLPTLDGLRDDGSAARVESTIPTATASAWPSIMTGKHPAKHGVTHFTQDDEVVSRDTVQSRYVWELVDDAGLDVCVIGVPVTYPPDETDGVVVSGMFTPEDADDWVSPAELVDDLPKPVFDTGHAPEDPLLDAIQSRIDLSLELLDRRDWDLFVTVFMESDRAGHSLLSPTDDGIEGYDAYERVYATLDDATAEIRSAADPRNTVVISDHGFGRAPRRRINVTRWLADEGFVDPPADAGSGLLTKERVEELLDDLDLVSYIPAPIRRFGREILPSERVEDDGTEGDDSGISYRGLWLHGGFEVNEDPDVEAELIDRLETATDPETGERLFERVVRTRDAFSGPYVDRLPDVLVRFHPNYVGESYYRESVVDSVPLSAVEMDHRYEGVLFTAGEDFAHHDGWIDGYHVTDFTPTLLHLLGRDVPEDCDGVVRQELFAPDSDAGRRAVSVGPASAQRRDRDGDGDYEEVTDRLSELGYLE
ncbi:MAG: alkaline phosphatase family protein [Halobaculum sp.]